MNFLGIDLGTSSVKIIIMNDEGQVTESVSKAYPINYPEVGWAEQNPEDWWKATKDGIKELLNNGTVKVEDINGIGISGQMHGLVILDEKNDVLIPAILWCDQRTEKQCDYLNHEFGQDKLSKYTGNKALTGFTIPKMLWVKENKPEIYNKIRHMMLPKDYINFKLTGNFSSDVSDASGTLMFDVEKRRWSKEMIELLEIDEKVLPRVFESWEVIGNISEQVSSEIGLSRKTVVVAGAGDQAAGAVGTGTTGTGVVSVAMGTSGVVFACDEKFSVDKENRLHSFCHANGKWHQMGVMLSGASCLQWWAENVHTDLPNTYEKLFFEASESPIGSNRLFFLPYLMGERTPYSDANAKGSFIGLNMTHKRGDMTRAILEGVCFGLRDSLEILKSIGVEVKEVRVTGGGARTKLWRQILADIFHLNICMINSTEGGAYGGAILASVGCGRYPSVDDACKTLIKITDITKPILENAEKYDKAYSIYSSLYFCLKDKFQEISNL